jgi:hypothetical protein
MSPVEWLDAFIAEFFSGLLLSRFVHRWVMYCAFKRLHAWADPDATERAAKS